MADPPDMLVGQPPHLLGLTTFLLVLDLEYNYLFLHVGSLRQVSEEDVSSQ